MGRPKKEVTQEMRVLKYIEDFGSISPLEAIRDLGVMRLAAVIYNLKHDYGIEIVTETETGNNRYGEPTHWARYSLAGGIENA